MPEGFTVMQLASTNGKRRFVAYEGKPGDGSMGSGESGFAAMQDWKRKSGK